VPLSLAPNIEQENTKTRTASRRQPSTCDRGTGRSPRSRFRMDFEIRATPPDIARNLPDNTSLLTAFKAAVERSPAPRNGFYERMALTVGATALMALQDTVQNRARMHVLSAPAGSGKTTLTNAFIEAMVEVVPLASALVVVEQIKSVEARFRDLDA